MNPVRTQILATIVTNPQSAEPLTLSLVVTGAVTRGVPINARLVASGGTGGYAIELIEHTDPPSGTAVDTNGAFSGTPDTQGHYAFIAQVTDSSATTSEPFSFAIDVVSRLKRTGKTPPIGEVGIVYPGYQFGFSGATGTVTMVNTGGTIPAGMDVSSGGYYSGTPEEPYGISTAQFRATDSGTHDFIDFEINFQILAALDAIEPSLEISILSGMAAVIDLMPLITGGKAPYTFAELSGIPDGMQIAQRRSDRHFVLSGVVNLNPLAVDEIDTVGITVTDALGASVDIAIALTIKQVLASLGTQHDGVDVGDRTPLLADFAGALVKSITVDADKTTITIELTPVTGFAAATGTADGTTFATYTMALIGGAYNSTTQAQVQAMSTHLQALSRQVKALKDALLALGALSA